MMVGIGLGVMALLCALGLISGGDLFMHHEWKDKGDPPAIQRNDDHNKPPESSQGFLEGQEKGPFLLEPAQENSGEESGRSQQCPKCG